MLVRVLVHPPGRPLKTDERKETPLSPSTAAVSGLQRSGVDGQHKTLERATLGSHEPESQSWWWRLPFLRASSRK